jgi:hypothetical protein
VRVGGVHGNRRAGCPRSFVYERERRSGVVTEIVRLPSRGHALTMYSGWREVAETALAFVKRFV